MRGSGTTAAPNATDGLSQIDTANTGCDAVDTSTVGTHTVTCTATDKAGNTATAQASYDVVLGFTGFAAPVDNDMVNVAKAGQAVPLKFQVYDANGPVTDLSADSVTVTVAASPVISPTRTTSSRSTPLAAPVCRTWATATTSSTGRRRSCTRARARR